MNKLMTINNDLITLEISNVLISPEAEKKRNRLFDGTYHIQSIGSAINEVSISCNINENAKAYLDYAYRIDAPIKLNWYGKYYVGLLKAYPSIKIVVKGSNTKRLYNADIIIVIGQEGVI